MSGIFVPLSEEEKEALWRLSDQEHRGHPKYQAQVLIREGLIIAGALPPVDPRNTANLETLLENLSQVVSHCK